MDTEIIIKTSKQLSSKEELLHFQKHTKFVSTKLAKRNFYQIAVKEKLIAMLIEKLQGVNIIAKQARDDADVLIIEIAIEESKDEKTAVIIGEDMDILVILIRTLSYEQEIFFKKVGKANVKTEIYSFKSVDKNPRF